MPHNFSLLRKDKLLLESAESEMRLSKSKFHMHFCGWVMA